MTAESAVPLDQLVGLTLDEARQWIYDSGFGMTVATGQPILQELAPSSRVIIHLDDKGFVIKATAG